MVSQFLFGRQTSASIHHQAHFENVLGTSLELRLEVAKTNLENTQNAILHEIERLEQIFSRFLPDSELNRLQKSHNEPFFLSPELEYVLLHALEWQRKSGGAFHIATDALLQLWQNAIPTQAELEPTVRSLRQPLLEMGVGYALHHAKLPINLNAIAKGCIADMAAHKAAQYASEVLVNLGGDLLHRGRKGVVASIANPHTPAANAAPLARVRICNQGLATSGHTQRGFWLGQQRFSRLLDPRNGQPVQQVLAASVIAPDAMTADVLATVCSVLAPEESLLLLRYEPQIGLCIATKERVYSNEFWKKHQLE